MMEIQIGVKRRLNSSTSRVAGCGKSERVTEGSHKSNNGVKQAIGEVSPAL
jgi:hypothetical protein